MADGEDFEEIKRIHGCTHPYFENLVNQVPKQKGPLSKRARHRPELESADVVKRRETFFSRVILELEDPRWYFPDLSTRGDHCRFETSASRGVHRLKKRPL